MLPVAQPGHQLAAPWTLTVPPCATSLAYSQNSASFSPIRWRMVSPRPTSGHSNSRVRRIGVERSPKEAVADAWGMVPTSQRLTPHPTASTHAHREDGKLSSCGMGSAGYARWGGALQPHMSSKNKQKSSERTGPPRDEIISPENLARRNDTKYFVHETFVGPFLYRAFSWTILRASYAAAHI